MLPSLAGNALVFSWQSQLAVLKPLLVVTGSDDLQQSVTCKTLFSTDSGTDAKLLACLQMAVLVLGACLEAWAACQVGQVECLTWVVPRALAVLVDPLLRKLTKLSSSRLLLVACVKSSAPYSFRS